MKSTKTKQEAQELFSELKQAVAGEVRSDRLTRQLYSTDASDFYKVPSGVVIPRDVDDICATMEIASRGGVAIISRGGGSSLTGQTVGAGLIVDHSKYLNKIMEINLEEKWVRVESGLVLDCLNAALVPHGLMVGPDPSSSSVATIGGMAGNNSTGSHSFRYGMIADHILDMEVVLADGSRALLSDKDVAAVDFLARQNSLEGNLYKQIPQLVEQYRDDIQSGYPKTWRNVAGYGLNRLLDARTNGKPFSLAPLIAGSEGTLATITNVKLGLVERPAAVNLMVLHFPELQQALEMVPPILEHGPAAVELMTATSIALADRHPGFQSHLRQFVQGHPGAILIVEFGEASQAELSHRLEEFNRWLDKIGYAAPLTFCATPNQVANVWQIRKSVAGLLLGDPDGVKPIWIIDDAAVPVDRLVAYTRDVVAAGRQFGLDIDFDAHASSGCLHMGVEIDLRTPEGLRHLELLSRKIMDIAIAHDGTTTGEHGEGLARSYFDEQLYGARLHKAFKSVKAVFDPERRLNPHKILDPIEPWDTDWLLYHPGYKTPLNPKPTFLDFSQYGGYAGLVEMCGGIGFCRSQVVGTMCPSYQVTRDELHTPRGRANALRTALTGQLGSEGLTSKEIHQSLELCLECKACRTECPAKVDIAKLKYEFLAQYQARHGVPLRSCLFAGMALTDALASKAPRIANALYQNMTFRKLLDRTVKIDQRRELPLLADETFQQWFGRRPAATKAVRGPVILWDDCHVSYHEPEIGVAAVKLLEVAGYEVRLINGRRCCGRPMISKGLLRQARANARHNVECLHEHAQRGTPIIGIEPSCIACFRDEYPSLLKSKDADQIANNAFFFEEFITDLVVKRELDLTFNEAYAHRKIKLHTHCYQKAFGTAAKVVDMLRLLSDTTVEEIDSGCCGMAGSFGYEKEHYDISMAIGEQSLFPAVRQADAETIIAAAGTSCRQQIRDGAQRKAVHPIILLANALK